MKSRSLKLWRTHFRDTFLCNWDQIYSYNGIKSTRFEEVQTSNSENPMISISFIRRKIENFHPFQSACRWFLFKFIITIAVIRSLNFFTFDLIRIRRKFIKAFLCWLLLRNRYLESAIRNPNTESMNWIGLYKYNLSVHFKLSKNCFLSFSWLISSEKRTDDLEIFRYTILIKCRKGISIIRVYYCYISHGIWY